MRNEENVKGEKTGGKRSLISSHLVFLSTSRYFTFRPNKKEKGFISIIIIITRGNPRSCKI